MTRIGTSRNLGAKVGSGTIDAKSSCKPTETYLASKREGNKYSRADLRHSFNKLWRESWIEMSVLRREPTFKNSGEEPAPTELGLLKGLNELIFKVFDVYNCKSSMFSNKSNSITDKSESY
jgi:hypothetical protein